MDLTWIKRGGVKAISDLYYETPSRVPTVIHSTAAESQQMDGLRKIGK